MRISDGSSDVCSSDLRGDLHVEIICRGFAWLDTGTHESLLQAAQFIETVEMRQGLKIACVEEIALQLGLISVDDVPRLIEPISTSSYGQYLAAPIATPPRSPPAGSIVRTVVL